MFHQYLLGQRLIDVQESQHKATTNQLMIESDKKQLINNTKSICQKPHAAWYAFAGGATVGWLKPKTHLSLLSLFRALSFLKL